MAKSKSNFQRQYASSFLLWTPETRASVVRTRASAVQTHTLESVDQRAGSVQRAGVSRCVGGFKHWREIPRARLEESLEAAC